MNGGVLFSRFVQQKREEEQIVIARVCDFRSREDPLITAEEICTAFSL
jgi:hypothetical protein